MDTGQVPAEKQPDTILLENGPHSALTELYFQGNPKLVMSTPSALRLNSRGHKVPSGLRALTSEATAEFSCSVRDKSVGSLVNYRALKN